MRFPFTPLGRGIIYSAIEVQGLAALAGAIVFGPEFAAVGGPAGAAIDAAAVAMGGLMFYVGETGRQQAADDLAEELSHNKGAKGDPDSKKNKIPDNDSTTGHIFRDAEGHIPDTPENRALLEDVAKDSANFRGTDKYGNEWYTKTQSDGSQVWVESRNGNIFEGGVNNTPKPWNPETGLKKP